MRVAAVIPAFQAESSVGEVVSALLRLWPERPEKSVVVIDDGSSDATADVARRAGALVVRHRRNRGKGLALRTGLANAMAFGATHVVTVDADGQHPADQAVELGFCPAPAEALVLGVRDLAGAGAPKANQRSNAISNYFLSRFTGQELRDTNCGLRRYPIRATLDLGASAHGFGFEVEVVLRAARARWPIAQLPVRVVYPPEDQRISHFKVVADPARIVARVLATLVTGQRR